MIRLLFLGSFALCLSVSLSCPVSGQEVEAVTEQETTEEEATPTPTPTPKVRAQPRSEAPATEAESPRTSRSETSAPTGSVQQMMTPEQFRAAGLNKLSAAELEKLNEFLYGYRRQVIQRAEREAAVENQNLIISRVDGQFAGLKGRTLIRLKDGSVWKQANPDDRYRGPGRPGEYVDLAAVVAKRGMFGWRMQIEGTPAFYVERVKSKQ